MKAMVGCWLMVLIQLCLLVLIGGVLSLLFEILLLPLMVPPVWAACTATDEYLKGRNR